MPIPAHRPLRILLLGDASNYHRCLSAGLQRLGHEVVVASNGSRWMDTGRDIDISRKPGKINGLLYWLNLWRRKELFTGYDVVQLVSPGFIEQRPPRISRFFDFVKAHNTHVYLTALGTDPYYVETCIDPDSLLRYSEWRIDDRPAPYVVACPDVEAKWLAEPLKANCKYIYDNVDGFATALYEYDLSVKRFIHNKPIVYAGIPIDVKGMEYRPLPDRIDHVRIFLGMHSSRMLEKGTDRILSAARRVAAKYPDKCHLDVVTDLPYNQYLERMRSAHIVLDQLYSFTPATNALLAMAMGIPTLSGGEEEYYRFIGEDKLRPIINALPDDEALELAIENAVLNPDDLRRRSVEGREFVLKHNDVDVVAQRFISLWNR